MIVTCIGHAKFLIEMENGLRLVTDPYDASCGYPVTAVSADVVLVSHGHHDHAAVATVSPTHRAGQKPRVIDQAGEYVLGDGVQIVAVPAYHDGSQGAKRGSTLLFALRAEGVNILHLGDLGHLPTPEQCRALGDADMVMIPVGGHYTINAEEAKQTAELLHAKVVLPMHYKTKANADWPIAPVDAFVALYPSKDVDVLDLLRVTAGDMQCQPHVAVLRPKCLK